MPGPFDYAFVFVLIALAVPEYLVWWPRFRRAVAAGDPTVRLRAYKHHVAVQWAFILCMTVIWLTAARPRGSLRLVAPEGWRAALAIVLVLCTLTIVFLQTRSSRRLTREQRARVASKFSSVTFILPHTAAEHRWFMVLSVTAGFCEELLCRGYLTWFFAMWFGLYGAYAIVIVLFGLGHAYQGRSGVIKTTIAGAVMTQIVVLTHSLIPGMIVHALIDIGSGTLGYRILRNEDPAPP